MKEFFAKYGGKYQDPYEAIELIGHKLHQIKDKVAKADPTHIKDLSAISDMIDDYVNSIKDGDLKPVQVGHEYQDQQMRGPRGGTNNYSGRDYPSYRDEHQRYDSRTHDRERRDFDDDDDYYSRRSEQSGNPGRHYRDGFSNQRR